MNPIRILDQQTANSIAAGEVVERPASVVKELVENSLDAGATTINLEITGGGILSMSVNDNGGGMNETDARIACARHATSKISTISDLDAIGTLGFRGEALASIAAVSKLTLRTRQPESPTGFEIRIAGGEQLDSGVVGCPAGTTIIVEQLFYNTPARFKFLKKDTSEAAAVAEIMERFVLARPDVSFRLLNNKQEVLHSPGNNDLLSAIYAVYGRRQAGYCVPVAGSNGPVAVSGYAARPEGSRGNRTGQTLFVNGRIIRSGAVTAAINEAYKTRLMKGRFAFTVLRLDLPPELVDVNVHPQKLEVRFWKDQDVFSAVYHALVSALNEHASVPGFEQDETAAPAITAASATLIVPAMPAAPAAPAASAVSVSPDLSVSLTAPPAAVYQLSEQPGQDRTRILRDGADTQLSGSEPQQQKLQVNETEIVFEASNPEQAPVPVTDDQVQSLLKAADLSQGRIIGQLFSTYILLEWQDELLMIDQHAAHEKILYEKLRAAWQSRQEPPTQLLLVPQTMTITAAEKIVFESEQDFFASLGFALEPFGNNSLLIRSLPDLDSVKIDAESAVRAALQSLQNVRRAAPDVIDTTVDETLYQVACKAAVKAHDKLTRPEIEGLLADLAPLENPYNCPHGRPVIIRMPRLELEKKFKRVL